MRNIENCNGIAIIGLLDNYNNSIAQILSSRYGIRCLDFYAILEKSSKNTIENIIEERGIKYLHALENATLRGVAELENVCFSLPSYFLGVSKNIEIMKNNYILIGLHKNKKECYDIINKSTNIYNRRSLIYEIDTFIENMNNFINLDADIKLDVSAVNEKDASTEIFKLLKAK